VKPSTKSTVRSHRPVAHGGRYSADARDPDIVDFSSNISPAGMPAGVRKALGRKLGAVLDYPDSNSSDLIRGLARYCGVPESRILAGNGAVEIIYNFCTAFASGKRALIQAPTFGEYEAACRLAGGRVSLLKSMSLADDLEPFISKIPRGGCVFVCNPNNPTGTMLGRQQMSQIILAARRKSALVFVDECFIELVPESDESVLGLTKRHDNLFVLRSLTKSFGLAGIRIGYAVSSKEMISTLQNLKIPWSVNALAQEAGLAAIRSESHLSKSRRMIKKESAFLKSKIAEIPGLECHDTSANFILIRTRHDSTRLQKRLLRHGVLIRDCKNFPGLDNHYIRVAVRSRRDNLKLVRALEAAA